MSYKQLTQKFFLIMLGLILFLIIPLVSYDPLHLYHKSWFNNESRLHGNMRLQAAGIINNYEFDSMIVGTSMLMGTPSIYASKNLGGTFVNVSAPAGNLYERNLIIKHALRKKNIKNIIYSFDTGLDANLKKNHSSLPLHKFDYLYDDTPLNDFYVYWNNKFMKCLLTFSSSSECIGGNRGLIRTQEWFGPIHEKNKKMSGIENWIKKDGRGKFVYSRIQKHQDKPFTKEQYETKLKLTYEIINEQLIDTIKNNMNVPFHIVFPPYSRMQYALWMKYNPLKYTLYKQTIEYLVDISEEYNNMYVYLLDDLAYLNDINNYRDMRHYNTDMNTIIVDYVRDQKYIRTLEELSLLFNKIDLANQSYAALDKEIHLISDAYKFIYSLTRKYTNNQTTIEGWALAHKVTNVELHLNGKKIKSMRLKKREDVFEKYPAYNQPKSGFLFKDIKSKSKNEKLTLIFKNKNRIIKEITILNKEGIQGEK